ncbi:O-antigen ligase family protein [Vibrio makurazakiensis]|uniref:O-antigen ligase family protein n=1 Tax=Vibrio makurazakiensis TaxID=2910250 RepID=UPI003D0D4FF4
MLKCTNVSVAKLSIFFTIFLLLWTKNYSVVITGITVLYSIYYLFINKDNISINKVDWVVIGSLSAYFISSIPLAVIDWGNFRYFRGASRLLLCLPLYFMLKSTITSTNAKEYYAPITWGVIGGSIGALGIALFQSIVEGRTRVDGFLYSINFGYLACVLAVLSIALFRDSKYKKLLIMSFICATAATLMTLTRGAIFTLPLVSLLGVFLTRQYLTIKTSFVVTIIVVLSITSFYNFSTHFQSRINYTLQEVSYIMAGDTEKAVSSGSRVLLWEASIEAFKSTPLFGLTHPQREKLNKELALKDSNYDWVATVSRGHAHSQYFDMLASGGTFGIIAIIFMLFVPFIYFIRHQKTSKAAYIGTLFVASYILICLTEVALQQNLISTFYGFMIALLFALTKAELKDTQIDQ